MDSLSPPTRKCTRWRTALMYLFVAAADSNTTLSSRRMRGLLDDRNNESTAASCYENNKSPGNIWHIDMTNMNTCTNNQEIPSGWTNPSMTSSDFFQPSCHECCIQMFPTLPNCICNDVCNNITSTIYVDLTGEGKEEATSSSSCSGPCCDRSFHPDITASQATCINTFNDGKYPSNWDNNPLMVGVTMFKTVEECCDTLTNGDESKTCLKLQAEECRTTTNTPEEEQCLPGAKCYVAGSTCADGTETCCGQTHYSLLCVCSDDMRGGLTFTCHHNNACTRPSCCQGVSPPDSWKDLSASISNSCQSLGQLCDTGIADDYCCNDNSSGRKYCSKSTGVPYDESDSVMMTNSPSAPLINAPTTLPTSSPSIAPTKTPTPAPVTSPPSAAPSKAPTASPTSPPSNSPTETPTKQPVEDFTTITATTATTTTSTMTTTPVKCSSYRRRSPCERRAADGCMWDGDTYKCYHTDKATRSYSLTTNDSDSTASFCSSLQVRYDCQKSHCKWDTVKETCYI